MPKAEHPSGLLKSFSVEDNPNGRQVISHAASQNVRPYKTNQEYLWAMREDLAIWLEGLYAVDINVINFFDVLVTGTLMCQHANNITTCAEYIRKNNIKVEWKHVKKFPTKYLQYNQGKYVRASSFFARDNIASFIGYCRDELQIPESVMFETNDLVLRYNEKNVILCLLEVARRGSKFGVPAPVLVQMEEDIDKEIELEKVAKEQNEPPPEPVKQKVNCDFKSLDEMVQHILGMCTCPNQFPMVKVSDGKYKVGDSENLIFMRILRQHVMVRVGGGWDTLEHYLNKHDPCRCFKHKNDRGLAPRHSRTQSASSRQSQQPANLTSTGTLLKTAAINRRLLDNKRLAKSTNNLSDISPLSKFDKTAPRRPPSRSRNSSTSETSISDTRSTKLRNSKSIELNPTKAVKGPANRRERQTVAGEDVFSRLYRPKSTPPVSRQTTIVPVVQNDLLMVQRTKKGSHKVVQRTTISGPPTPRLSQFNKTKVSPEKNASRTKSVVTPRTSRSEKSTMSSRTPRATLTVAPSRTVRESRSRPASARTPKTTSKPSECRVVDDKEKEKLEAFEKECISNQLSLKHDEANQRKKSTSESNSETLRKLSRSSAEDNEVAMHMQQVSETAPRPSHPPSSYHSLPRPRKDKVSKHEHPTRIPTPISFSKPLLNGGNIDLSQKMQTKPNLTSNDEKQMDENKKLGAHGPNQYSLNGTKKIISNGGQTKNEPKKYITNGTTLKPQGKEKVVANGTVDISPSKSKEIKANGTSAISRGKDKEIITNGAAVASPSRDDKIVNDGPAGKSRNNNHKIIMNGGAGGAPTHPAPDLRKPRLKISVEEINQLLNSNRSNVKRLQSASKPARAILTEFPHTESNPIRSTAGSAFVKPNRNPSAFVRVDNRPNGDANSYPAFPPPNHVKPKKHPPSSYPRYSAQVQNSVSVDLNDNFAGFNSNQPQVSQLFKQNSLRNSLRDSDVTPNGHAFSPTPSESSEVYWV